MAKKKDIYAGPNDSPKFGRLIQTADDPQPPNWANYANGNDYQAAYQRWATKRKRKRETSADEESK